MKWFKSSLFVFFTVMSTNIALAQDKTLVVKADKPIADIQPTMWGIFFEDINLGADGGIYAELIKNRSFEFFKPLITCNAPCNWYSLEAIEACSFTS